MLFIPTVISTITDNDDRGFMEHLYVTYHRMMFRTAYRYTHSQFDTEDVIHNAVLSLIPKIHLLRSLDKPQLHAYVHATVSNKSRLFLRSRGKWVDMDIDTINIPAPPDETSTPGVDLLKQCTLQELKEVLLLLQESDLHILTMKYFLKLDDLEIARDLGIQPVSVRSRLTRARQRAYEKFKELYKR